MSEFVIYLKLKPFVRQWLVNHYGDPVRFDPRSVANAKIISVLQNRRQEDVPAEDDTAVCIPYSKQKDPSSWRFVSEAGKRFIVDHIESIFLSNLWNEMSQMVTSDSKLQSAAYAWCEMHGIDLSYADTIRMRFYREKKRLLHRNIDLRSKQRKRK